MIEKPKSLTIKEFINRSISTSLMIPEKTVDAVISHQFMEAEEAMKKFNSIEISGFGKFLFNQKKAEKRMEKFISQKNLFEQRMNDLELSERKRETAKYKYEAAVKNITDLTNKL